MNRHISWNSCRLLADNAHYVRLRRWFLVGAALLGCDTTTTALFWRALMARPDLAA